MRIGVVFRHMDPSGGLRQYHMYAAIDLVVDKLDRQIRETRERRREPRRSAEA
jgi:ribosome-associated translation inhibitor RaiA